MDNGLAKITFGMFVNFPIVHDYIYQIMTR